MTAQPQRRLRPGIAAALEIVQSSLGAAERALLTGQDIDLAHLEAQMRVLCAEAALVEPSARRTASDTLAQVLERLTTLEATVAATARR